MLTLTPDEILNEISGKLAMQASKAADMKRDMNLLDQEIQSWCRRKGRSGKSNYIKKGFSRKKYCKTRLIKTFKSTKKTDYPMGKGANYQQKPGM